MSRPCFRVCFTGGAAIVLTLLVSAAIAQSADKKCQCRAPGGGMRDLGTVQCIDIAGNAKLVMCMMSTNTPYWKDVPNVDGCPAA